MRIPIRTLPGSPRAEKLPQLIDGFQAPTVKFSKKFGSASTVQASRQAVGRQDFQARRVHVDKRHHHFLGVFETRVVFLESQRRLVAMMPIGDEQLLIGHQLLNAADYGAVSEIFHTR